MNNVKRKFKVIYWYCGQKRSVEVEAYSKYDAKRVFYMTHSADDIVRIEEVKDNV